MRFMNPTSKMVVQPGPLGKKANHTLSACVLASYRAMYELRVRLGGWHHPDHPEPLRDLDPQQKLEFQVLIRILGNRN